MSKQNYMSKITASRVTHDRELIRMAVHQTLDMVTIALNEQEEFGPTRVARLKKRVGELFDEYMALSEDGYDYANEKIKARVAQITGREQG